MHYAGPIETETMLVLPGWAACMTGSRTEKARRDGRVTRDRSKVTCRRCLDLIAKHDKWGSR